MANPFFRFKQFTVFHDRCAMKVGTDGVILGAWCNVDGANKILDVGTGCGLIALMLAQRNPKAQITGIDIDEAATLQAQENVLASPFRDRVALKAQSFRQYVKDNSVGYELIMSNPPFFTNSLLPPDRMRGAARHSVTLTLDELLRISSQCLVPWGALALILPYDRKDELDCLKNKYGYRLKRMAEVKPLPDSAPKRLLVELTLQPVAEPVVESITIELSRHCYSPEFRALTNDFYL